MAPDPASAKAGQGQASPARWGGLSHDEQAVSGSAGGSGAAPYRAQAALADGATKCSCPSRKFLMACAAIGRAASDGFDAARTEASPTPTCGWYLAQLGEHQQALQACQQALADQQELGDRESQAHTWHPPGTAGNRQARSGTAVSHNSEERLQERGAPRHVPERQPGMFGDEGPCGTLSSRGSDRRSRCPTVDA
jgi:hypothetical protein